MLPNQIVGPSGQSGLSRLELGNGAAGSQAAGFFTLSSSQRPFYMEMLKTEPGPCTCRATERSVASLQNCRESPAGLQGV